jgi:hypothetical protein
MFVTLLLDRQGLRCHPSGGPLRKSGVAVPHVDQSREKY